MMELEELFWLYSSFGSEKSLSPGGWLMGESSLGVTVPN